MKFYFKAQFGQITDLTPAWQASNVRWCRKGRVFCRKSNRPERIELAKKISETRPSTVREAASAQLPANLARREPPSDPTGSLDLPVDEVQARQRLDRVLVRHRRETRLPPTARPCQTGI